MRKYLLAAGLLIFLFTVSVPSDAAGAAAKVVPSRVQQGDAFVITVSGAGNEPPAATFRNEEMDFSRCGDGCFISIGAVDIDTKPGVYKIAVVYGNKQQMISLSVKRAQFPSLSLTLPEQKVTLGPEDQARADREAELLQSLWKKKTGRLWDGSFTYPLKNAISTAFGTKRIINKKKTSIHRGIDMKGKEGEEVCAANSGRVVLAEDLFFGGNTIVIDHGQGIYTVYMHLSGFSVKPEDAVTRGAVIGFVGSSGRASGPHLHFGVKVGAINANPVSLMGLQL